MWIDIDPSLGEFDNLCQLKGILLGTFWEWYMGLDTLKLGTK